MAHCRADTQGNTGNFMGCQRYCERETRKNQRRQLDKAGTTTGKRRKQVGYQGNKEQDQLIQPIHYRLTRHANRNTMITNFRFKYGMTLALGAVLGFATVATHAGKLYKWVDDSGQTRYGDRIPAQYAKKKNETLSDQGIVVETKAAAKTPEQIAEEKRLAAQKAEQERIRAEAARKDRILLDTFTNEDEMIMTRDGKIEAIGAVIRVTNDRTEKNKLRLADMKRRAANMERSGKALPKKLLKNIADIHNQIQSNTRYVANRIVEQQRIREKFEADIKRFRELNVARAGLTPQ